jgi:hypothetical protein
MKEFSPRHEPINKEATFTLFTTKLISSKSEQQQQQQQQQQSL